MNLKPSTPQPVLLHGTAAQIAGAAATLLVLLGTQSDTAGKVGSLIGAGAVVLLGIVSLLAARRKVTPIGVPDGGTGADLLAQLADAAVSAALERVTHPVAALVAPSGSTVLGGVVEQPSTLTPGAPPAAPSESVGTPDPAATVEATGST